MPEVFSCKCCGHCCSGTGGIVVSPSDLPRLCAHLGITPEEFEHAYGERRGPKLLVRAKDGACVFFSASAGCSIHEAKPDICRAWPYFRGNLVDPDSLALAKDFCPGIPPKISHDEFVRQGLKAVADAKLVLTKDAAGAEALRLADLPPASGPRKR